MYTQYEQSCEIFKIFKNIQSQLKNIKMFLFIEKDIIQFIIIHSYRLFTKIKFENARAKAQQNYCQKIKSPRKSGSLA